MSVAGRSAALSDAFCDGHHYQRARLWVRSWLLGVATANSGPRGKFCGMTSATAVPAKSAREAALSRRPHAPSDQRLMVTAMCHTDSRNATHGARSRREGGEQNAPLGRCRIGGLLVATALQRCS